MPKVNLPVLRPNPKGSEAAVTAGATVAVFAAASSAVECGPRIDASGQSVYNWEEGKARRCAQQLLEILALRNLGRRRRANAIL
jgi:hypothetical protein